MRAKYFDGKTAKKKSCELVLNNNYVEIKLLEEDSNQEQIIWHIDEIHKMDVLTSNLTLRYGQLELEILELENKEDFNEFIRHYPNAAFHKSKYNSFASLGWKGILTSIVAIIGFSILFFLYGTPFLAESFAQAIPKEYEEYIGENVKEFYFQYLDIDEEKSKEIQSFYDHLDYQSEYDIRVEVAESSQINAFALPGGHIVVFSGILEIMDEPEELAALLAHETMHINERHSLRMMSRNLSTYLLISILTGDVGGFSSIIIDNSNMISSLTYSRSLEKEADLKGIELMMNSEIDPSGMVNLFEKFQFSTDSIQEEYINLMDKDSIFNQTISDTGSTDSEMFNKALELLSTHPNPENRIEYLNKAISEIDLNQAKSRDSLEVLFDKIVKVAD